MYGFVLNLQNKMADFSSELYQFLKIKRPRNKPGPNSMEINCLQLIL